jgi:hypothetical protein
MSGYFYINPVHSLFTMIHLDVNGIELRLRHKEGKTSVFDPVRKRWLILTPEEHIRQYLLHILMHRMGYPASLLAVEKRIDVGGLTKPWMLAECKRPDVAVTDKTLHQLLAYQSSVQCRYWLLSNGHQTLCADATDVADIKWLTELPLMNG